MTGKATTGKAGPAAQTKTRRPAVRATVEEAVAEMQAGRAIIVTDD